MRLSFLMMGTDMFLSFQDWYSPQEIARCAQLVCFSRYDADAENRAALAEESERITRELEPQLSDLALDLVNHLQHWQDDRHSAVDAETIAAPYADIEHLTAGEHTNATTNRTK